MTTTYLSAFSGSNISASSTINNPDTSTPTLNVTPFNPDPLETIWQQYLFGVSDVAGKTLNIVVNTTNKETDSLYAGTYDGPWWSTDPAALVWNKVTSFVSSGSTMTYSISPGANSTIYIASLPPHTLPRTLAWINNLAATYPSLIHDDLKPRIRKGLGAYICALSGTHKDETGRTVSGLPHYGFRISNDSVAPTSPNAKRELILMAGVHSNEWNGFLELQGFVDELLTNASLQTLLDNFNIFVYPAHSVGGMDLGFRRAEAINSTTNSYDANRYWGDGTGTVPTIALWQDIMDEQHGVFLHNVVGQIDFHDATKDNSSDGNAYFNYQGAMANYATINAAMVAENADLAGVLTTVAVTTNEYFFNKGVNFSITVESRDERNTTTQAKEYGRATARAVKTIYQANLLDTFDGTILGSPEVESFETGTGGWTLNTGSAAWTRSNGTTPSANTGADTAFDGSWRVFTEAGTSGSPVADGTTFILEKTGIDFDLYAEMRFRWMRYGCQSSTLSVQINTGSGYSTVWSSSVNLSTQVWKQEGIDLSGLSYHDGAIRFLVTVSGTNRHMNDQDIDYIEFVPYLAGSAELIANLSSTLGSMSVSSASQLFISASAPSLQINNSVASSIASSGSVQFFKVLEDVSVSSIISNPIGADLNQELSVSLTTTLTSNIVSNAPLTLGAMGLSSTISGDAGESNVFLDITLGNITSSSALSVSSFGDLSKTLGGVLLISNVMQEIHVLSPVRTLPVQLKSRIAPNP